MENVSIMAGTNSVEATRHYVCGGIASLCNVFVTFPINKIMFRQQIEGIRTLKAIKQIFYYEGLHLVYRGLLPPLIQRTLTVSLMFGTYNQTHNFIIDHSPVHLSLLVSHSLAASFAGCTEAVLMPFERAQCLLQAKNYNQRLSNTWHTFKVLHQSGFKEFYRGLSAVVIRNCLSNILFLGLREPIKEYLPTPKSHFGESLCSFISGAGLGMVLSTMFFPLNVVKNRMMTDTIGGEFLNISTTFRTIFNERNRKWRKMFRGVHINYTRAFISWGIINMVYDFLMKLGRLEKRY